MQEKIHLTLPGCSGRGVRLKSLDTKQRELAQVTVAKKLGGSDGTTMIEYEQALARECLCMMITGVTKPGADEKDLLAKAGWTKLTYVDLTDDRGDRSFLRLFANPKDAAVLHAYYTKTCVVTQAQVDAVLGKAITVDDED